MKQIQLWVAMVAAAACLALAVIGSAGEDTQISPEAHWPPTPPTLGLVPVPQERAVSTAHGQASNGPPPAAMPARRRPLSLSAAAAAYQRVNRTVHTAEGPMPAWHTTGRGP
jgi:hypothetical protein